MQVNFDFYLPNTISTCPAKGVTELTQKWLFYNNMYLLWPINCFPARSTSVLLKKYWNSLVLLYLWSYMMKSYLPCRTGTLYTCPSAILHFFYLSGAVGRAALIVEPCCYYKHHSNQAESLWLPHKAAQDMSQPQSQARFFFIPHSCLEISLTSIVRTYNGYFWI